MLALPATPIRLPLQKTCGNTPPRLSGSNTLVGCTANTHSPEQARPAVKRKHGDFHSRNRKCCCSNEACQALGGGRDKDFVQIPPVKAGQPATDSRAYKMLLTLKDGKVSEVENAFNSTKKTRPFIRKTHFNLDDDFKYFREFSRLKPAALPNFELQIRSPSPSSLSSPTQQPIQHQEQQEQHETPKEDTNMMAAAPVPVPAPEPLAKRLAAFFSIHNPAKLLDPCFVVDCANHYQDKPDQLERILVSKYGSGLTSSTQQQHQQLQDTLQVPQPPATTASPPPLSESVLAMRLSAFYSVHNTAKVLDPEWIVTMAEDWIDKQQELENHLVAKYNEGLRSERIASMARSAAEFAQLRQRLEETDARLQQHEADAKHELEQSREELEAKIQN
jgi:hypothetical protein